MENINHNKLKYNYLTFFRDFTAGIAVFFVALPLCLGVAIASNAPVFSGLLAGIIGGLIVGAISGSKTSVSGPAAGLTAVVAKQIETLGTFEAFLLATVFAGIFQIILSIFRMGSIAVFFPSSVIKGLLTAIGLILILKQIPHLFGYDMDPMGEKSFIQIDEKNTFSGLIDTFYNIHPGASLIGLVSFVVLVLWEKMKSLKKSPIPSPVIAVTIGILMGLIMKKLGGNWEIEPDHFVQVPVPKTTTGFFNFLIYPDFNLLNNVDIYIAAITVGIVASLETLLNIEAVDKLDPEKRLSPPNRELFAQGVGNTISGLIGGIPITSVIVRSSVNINAGVKTKASALWHGFLLLVCVIFIPNWLNTIPLSSLAAILIITGIKLVNPSLLKKLWKEGKTQFLPYIATVLVILFTDLLIGILVGLFVAIGFILYNNARNPLRKIMEKHATGDQVLRIDLPTQVSFFNKSNLDSILKNAPRGGHILLDATSTDYIDPDILDLIIDFQNVIAPVHGVKVSLKGFNHQKQLKDRILYVDYSHREMQEGLTTQRILEVLKEGNRRFRNGTPITRDSNRLINQTSTGQFPMAIVLSCIDSRTPVEIVFDLGLGDIFSIRIAGNTLSQDVIGSMEFGIAVAGAKLILVMGHTSCGAIKAAVEFAATKTSAKEAISCTNLDGLLNEIKYSIKRNVAEKLEMGNALEKDKYCDQVACEHVKRTIALIKKRSPILDKAEKNGEIAIIGSMYDISSGEVSFFD